MYMDRSDIRHAQLFEMLRKNSLSEKFEEERQAKSEYVDDEIQAELLKKLAVHAWSLPRIEPEDSQETSAAEPGCDDEFFGTVRP